MVQWCMVQVAHLRAPSQFWECAYVTYTIIINESGLYALVLSSKLGQASVFNAG